MPWAGVLELLLGLYCAHTLAVYIVAAKFTVSPFIAIYTAGFLFIGLMTIAEALDQARQRD
jgi:hypothetical protein